MKKERPITPYILATDPLTWSITVICAIYLRSYVLRAISLEPLVEIYSSYT